MEFTLFNGNFRNCYGHTGIQIISRIVKRNVDFQKKLSTGHFPYKRVEMRRYVLHEKIDGL